MALLNSVMFLTTIIELSKNFLDSSIIVVKNITEFNKAIENKKIAAAYHCQDLKCEDSLKNKINGIKAICIPLNKAKKNDKCILCNKTQSMIVYFAKSY